MQTINNNVLIAFRIHNVMQTIHDNVSIAFCTYNVMQTINDNVLIDCFLYIQCDANY